MVNERQTAIISVSFFKEGNIAVKPTAGVYTIRDVTDEDNPVIIRDETDFTPDDVTYPLNLSTDDTRILNPDNKFEKRLVTMEWDYGTESHGTTEVKYSVKNLLGVI